MLSSIEKALDKAPEDDHIQRSLDATPFLVEYKNKLGLIAISFLLAFICIGIFYVSAKKIVPPELVFLYENGKYTAITSMRLPNQSHEAIKDWARETVQKTYNFNFSNFDSNLATARGYFTDDAWDVYTNAFLKSELVKAVKRDKMTVSVVVKEDPIIETAAATGKDGEFAWKLILPVTLSFSGDIPTEAKDLVMRVTVVRVPTVDNPKGLGVVQMSSAPVQAGAK